MILIPKKLPMNTWPVYLCLLALFISLPAHSYSQGPVSLEQHPRLWVDSLKLVELQKRVLDPTSVQSHAFEALKARAVQFDPNVYEGRNYGYSFMAREAALAYLLTSDTAWSNLAFNALQKLYNYKIESSIKLPDSGYGLGRATVGLGFAVAYDFCYNGWSLTQKQWVKSIIVKSLNEWTELEYPQKTGNHVWAPYHSNWVAVCRGAELMMMLSVYQEKDTVSGIYQADVPTGSANDIPLPSDLTRKKRYGFLKNLLLQNIQSYGTLGVTGEGNSYAMFAGQFLVPALIALRNVGDSSLDTEAMKHPWWRWMMQISSFSSGKFSLQNGVGNPGDHQDGWMSAMLGYVPDQDLPYYLYWYDRYIGVLSPGTDAKRFDYRRAGTVWNILFYPLNPLPSNPSGKLPVLAIDEKKGAFFFRNQWKDSTDVLFSVLSDQDWNENVHNQSEAFHVGLTTHGTLFFHGPGMTSNSNQFSSLLVDGKAFEFTAKNMESSDTGVTQFAQRSHTGGYVLVDGGEKYRNLGLKFAQRHALVDFYYDTPAISILDDLNSVVQRQYAWQLNIPPVAEGGPLAIEDGVESGRQFFILRGRGDSWVKAWILSDEGSGIKVAKPFQIQLNAASAKIWVAMLIGTGIAPVATITGSGMESELTANGIHFGYSPFLNRLYFGEAPIVGIFSKDKLLASRRKPSVLQAISGQGSRIILFSDGNDALYTPRGRNISLPVTNIP